MPKIRQTKRIFRWHVAVPATLTGIAGILLCCADAAPIPMVIAVAVVFLLSGIAAVAGYFINASQNIAGVLIGAGQVAVSVWMFMEYNALPWTVLGLACGALACLYALFCVLEGVALRRTERIWPARIVFAALYAALGILLVVNYFAPFFGDSVNCVVTAGAFACVVCAAEWVFLYRAGLFFVREEVYDATAKSSEEGSALPAPEPKGKDGEADDALNDPAVFRKKK